MGKGRMNKSTCLGTARTPTERAVEATWSGIPSAFRQSQTRPRLKGGVLAPGAEASCEQSFPGRRSPLVALRLVLPIRETQNCRLKAAEQPPDAHWSRQQHAASAKLGQTRPGGVDPRLRRGGGPRRRARIPASRGYSATSGARRDNDAPH